MLQQDQPDDYVDRHRRQPLGARPGRDRLRPRRASTGSSTSRSIRALLRPAEVDHLIGDPAKARAQLGWEPTVDFKALVEMMVDADLAAPAARPKSASAVASAVGPTARSRVPGRMESHAVPGEPMVTLEQIQNKDAPGRRHRPRLRRPAARRRVRHGRVRRHRLRRRRRRRSSELNAGRSYIPDVPEPTRWPPSSRPGTLPRDDRHGAAGRDGRDRHLRADAAAQDEGPGPVLRRAGGRGRGAHAAARPARHPRVDDLSGDDRRSRAADARGGRAEGRTSTSSSRSRPSASIRQPAVHDAQHPEGRRRRRPGQHRSWRARSTAQVVDDGRAGQLDARRRDGQAAREHVPRRQHRAGQRDRADVPQDGHRRLGGHRRGQDQAVRLHAVLSGSGPRRALHPDRSVLPVVEGAAERLRVPVHRAGGPGQRRRCRSTSCSGSPTR